MKKILFAVLLLLISATAFSQTYNVTFPFDSGAVYSDSVQFKNDNQWLAAIFVSDTLNMDTFYVQVCFDTSAHDTTAAGVFQWYYLWEDGARYTIVGSNTESTMIAVKPLAIYPVGEGTDPREFWVRLVCTTSDVEVGAISIKAITKTFK